MTAGQADELTKSRGAAPTAVLFDPHGRGRQMYGATNAWHMYVIDKAGVLQYAAPSRQAEHAQERRARRPELRARGARSVAAGQPVKTPSRVPTAAP